jgi:hypothetical protein
MEEGDWVEKNMRKETGFK